MNVQIQDLHGTNIAETDQWDIATHKFESALTKHLEYFCIRKKPFSKTIVIWLINSYPEQI